MRARSATTGSPPMDLPSPIGNVSASDLNGSASRISRSRTVSRRAFGNSSPIALRPGTTAARTLARLIERAMSSASPMMRDDFVPRDGSNSYSVTTGPGRISLTSPLTPKSASTSSSSRALPRMTVCESSGFGFAAVGRLNMLSDGRFHCGAARFLRPPSRPPAAFGAATGSGAAGCTTGAWARDTGGGGADGATRPFADAGAKRAAIARLESSILSSNA